MADKIKVFGSDDDLKELGELLSNATSRKIIAALIKQPMYTNELSTTLDIRVSLVIHHLDKLKRLGLVDITHKKLVRKGQEHKFYKINSDIFIALNNTKEEVKEEGFSKKFFRDGIKFAVIGIAALSSWFVSSISLKPAIILARAGVPSPPGLYEYQSIIIGLVVIIFGLSIIIIRK